MRSQRFLVLLPWAGLLAATIAACSGSGNTTPMSVGGSGTSDNGGSGDQNGGGSGSNSTGSGASAGSSASGSSSNASGSQTASGSGGGSGSSESGASAGGTDSGSSGGGSSGSAGSGSSGSGGSGVSSSDGGIVSMPSPGCGKAWTHATGKYVEVAGPNMSPGLTVYTHLDYHPTALGPTVPITVQGTVDNNFTATEQRGYWVLIPEGYDANKPYKVIYQGAGCDDVDAYNAGQDGLPFQSYDNGGAIQVGLDYDTQSLVPECYNNQDPDSNDFTFMPWLMNEIENDFCVDETHQFWEGYSSGGWVDQQFNCAFPSKFRGFVSVTGSEPPNQPTCNPAPTAWMHIHDSNDTSNSYASILPGCTRILKQNGCSVTDCSDPTSTKVTTPYTFPPAATNAWVKNIPGGTTCVQFNGCPAEYPVVFCTTTGQDHQDQRAWSVPAFWDFMSRVLN